jgi:hypothetical protein
VQQQQLQQVRARGHRTAVEHRDPNQPFSIEGGGEITAAVEACSERRCELFDCAGWPARDIEGRLA